MARRLLSSAVAVVVMAGCGLGVASVDEDGLDSAASPLTELELEGRYRLQIDRNEVLTIDGLRRFHQQVGVCLAQSGADCLEASFAATLGPAVEVSVSTTHPSVLPPEGLGITGNKWGYGFQLRPDAREDGGVGWSAEAGPIVYRRTGVRSFYIDETGILLGADVGGGAGDAGMPEI